MTYNTNPMQQVFYLNGKKASSSLIKAMIAGLNDKKIRTEKGGYLFKAASQGKKFFLSILPEFHMGERNYHYNIELPGDPVYFLTGSLNPEGVFSLLFVPRSKELTEKDKETYQKLYVDFAVNLLDRGLNGPGELDEVTPMLLQQSGLFAPEIPRSLKAIRDPGE
jgi:hypothetical protein